MIFTVIIRDVIIGNEVAIHCNIITIYLILIQNKMKELKKDAQALVMSNSEMKSVVGGNVKAEVVKCKLTSSNNACEKEDATCETTVLGMTVKGECTFEGGSYIDPNHRACSCLVRI